MVYNRQLPPQDGGYPQQVYGVPVNEWAEIKADLSQINKSIESINTRMDKTDEQVSDMRVHLSSKIDNVRHDLEKKIDIGNEKTNGKIDNGHTESNTRDDSTEKRIDSVESTVSEIKAEIGIAKKLVYAAMGAGLLANGHNVFQFVSPAINGSG